MWSTRDLLASALLSAVIAVVTTIFFEKKITQLVESRISARYMDMQLATEAPRKTMGAIGKGKVSIPPPIGAEITEQSDHPDAPMGAGTKWTPF